MHEIWKAHESTVKEIKSLKRRIAQLEEDNANLRRSNSKKKKDEVTIRKSTRVGFIISIIGNGY